MDTFVALGTLLVAAFVTGASAVCNPNPCDPGLCVPWNDRYECICPPHRSGVNCSDAVAGAEDCACQWPANTDPCSSNPCLGEDSICINTFNDTFKCLCPPHSSGDRCQNSEFCLLCESWKYVYKECSVSGPLAPYMDLLAARIDNRVSRRWCMEDVRWGMNGSGVWVDDGCRAQFCIAYELDGCMNNPCGVNETCVDLYDSYTCLAPEPPVAVTACDADPCQNGATCVADGSTNYTCACPLGTTGDNCETLIQLLLTTNQWDANDADIVESFVQIYSKSDLPIGDGGAPVQYTDFFTLNLTESTSKIVQVPMFGMYVVYMYRDTDKNGNINRQDEGTVQSNVNVNSGFTLVTGDGTSLVGLEDYEGCPLGVSSTSTPGPDGLRSFFCSIFTQGDDNYTCTDNPIGFVYGGLVQCTGGTCTTQAPAAVADASKTRGQTFLISGTYRMVCTIVNTINPAPPSANGDYYSFDLANTGYVTGAFDTTACNPGFTLTGAATDRDGAPLIWNTPRSSCPRN